MVTDGRYSVSVEWLNEPPTIAIIRLHEAPARRYGDPYIWSAVLERNGPHGDAATIKGMVSPPPLAGLRLMHTMLRAAGITRRRHERVNGGQVRQVERRITKVTAGEPEGA